VNRKPTPTQMQEELFGTSKKEEIPSQDLPESKIETETSTGNLKQRKKKTKKEEEVEMDEKTFTQIMDSNRNQQENLTNDMVIFARNLKENSLQISNTLKKDSQVS